jgi:hypothetical protein
MNRVKDLLEEAATSAVREADLSNLKEDEMVAIAQLSIAVSLKRIADKFDLGISPALDGQLTDLAWRMGQAFAQGSTIR